MNARSLQAFLPVEAAAQQQATTTMPDDSIPAPSLQGLSIVQQAALRRPAYNPVDFAPLSSRNSCPPAANGESNCNSMLAADDSGAATHAPAPTGTRSSAPELPSKPKVTSQYVPPAKRSSSAGILTRRPASDSGSAPTPSANRTPPPGFEVPGNAQRWHNRSISAGSSGGGRSSAPPATAASVARPRDSGRISASGSAAPRGWQNIVVNGGGSSKPYASGAGASQHQAIQAPSTRYAHVASGPPTPQTPAAPPAAPAAAAVRVPACKNAECLASKGCWCDVDLEATDTDFSERSLLDDLGRFRGASSFTGMHRTYAGASVLVATKPAELTPALRLLEESAVDNVFAIDAEWKPDTEEDEDNHIALLQLATPTCVLLIKVAGLLLLPSALDAFLRAEGRTFVGLGWPSAFERTFVGLAWSASVEHKMTQSFGFGRSDFFRFIDLQEVLTDLGYAGDKANLTSAAHHCFGLTLPRMQGETESNWEAILYTARQVLYAARDALVTLHCYRRLRLWHHTHIIAAASGKPCQGCGRAFGMHPDQGAQRFLCLTPGCFKSFATSQALAHHGTGTRHRIAHVLCPACGRISAAP